MSIKKELSRVINTYSYDTLLNMSDDDIADYIIESLKDLSVFSTELERNSLELAREGFFKLRSKKTIKKRLDEIKADKKNTIAKPLKQETNKKEEDLFNNTLNTNDTDS